MAALTELRKQCSSLIDPVAEIMVMKELPQPRPTFILRRGAYDAPTDPVSRDTPAALLPFSPGWPRNRLGLARWVTDPETALDRASNVNRWWQSDLRPGNRGNPRRFRQPGTASLASRIARLAGAELHRLGLEREGTMAADRDLGDLPASLGRLLRSFWLMIRTTSCSDEARGSGFRPR